MRLIHPFLLGLAAFQPSLAAPARADDGDVSLASRGESHWFPIAQYQVKLQEVIGRGAFATVYAVETHPKPKQGKLCVKVHQGPPDIIPPFLQLMRTVVDVGNVIACYGTRYHENTQYALMERAETDIESNIRAGTYSTDDRIRSDICGMARGLATMHHAGVAHNDAHAGNVVLIDGSAKMVDFDLITAGPYQPRSCGRLDVQGPEALGLTGMQTEVYRNDVWGVGVTLIRMITGRNPWGTAAEPFPRRIWSHPSRTERQRLLKKYYPRLSNDLCFILAKVFTTQDQRYMANDLQLRLKDLGRFISQSPRALAAREIEVDEGDLDSPANYMCIKGADNSTHPSNAPSHRSVLIN